ncbi:hypothetical protein L1987_67000 [Smallanthus sonchifolius]|uniref:Uncharacterized protein n=1 Tax=Smallanthus sonchifolius TaxID=185202 RepID=A0ACB9BYP1_9ASTR|nr:hypothetical protein L1987_67000 [Smallanthus sonchifolius]
MGGWQLQTCASQDLNSKSNLWGFLKMTKENNPGPWIMLGDFNEVRNASERLNSDFNIAGAASKLDRALVCREFMDKWPDASLTAWLRVIFDHCPITLKCSSVDFGSKPFRFFNSWIGREGVMAIIEGALKIPVSLARPDAVLAAKLKNVKFALKKWTVVLCNREEKHADSLRVHLNNIDTMAELIGLNSYENEEGWLQRQNCWRWKN